MQHRDVVWQKTWHKWVTCTEDGRKKRNDVAGGEKKDILLLYLKLIGFQLVKH